MNLKVAFPPVFSERLFGGAFPDRIEKAIYTHPSVELCFVTGNADRDRINYPKAYVVLKDRNKSGMIKEKIMEICRELLPEYMVSEDIQFMNDLSRTPRGKIDYRALEDFGNI